MESKKRTFDHREVAMALVRNAGIHEGLWRIGFEFDLRAANINLGPGRGQVPAAFIPVLGVNILRVDTMDDLTVDAAIANPLPRIIMPVN